MGVNGEMVGKLWEATKLDDIDIDKKYCQKNTPKRGRKTCFRLFVRIMWVAKLAAVCSPIRLLHD